MFPQARKAMMGLFRFKQNSGKVLLVKACLIVAAIIAVFGAGFYVGRSRWSADLASGSYGGQEKWKTTGQPNVDPDSAADREKKNAKAMQLEALKNAADESEKKQNEAFSPPALVVATGPGGRLTTAAIERLHLTDKEVDSISNSIQAVRNQIIEDFTKRVKLVDSRSAGGQIYYNYFARARQDQGQEYLNTLAGAFEAAIGKERAGQLMSGVVGRDIFGGFGDHDLEIEFFRKKFGTTVKCKYLNPKTGAVMRSCDSTLDSFKEDFGDVFEFPDVK